MEQFPSNRQSAFQRLEEFVQTGAAAYARTRNFVQDGHGNVCRAPCTPESPLNFCNDLQQTGLNGFQLMSTRPEKQKARESSIYADSQANRPTWGVAARTGFGDVTFFSL